MRILLFIPIILFFKFQQTTEKLNGEYQVVSNQKEEECFIFFNDSVNKKVFSSGKEINGVIKYGNLIYLTDYESSLKVVGQKTIMAQAKELKEQETTSLRKGKNGEINFCLHRYRKDGPMNWLDICQSSGKMVKVE